jgi:hypothetical protein
MYIYIAYTLYNVYTFLNPLQRYNKKTIYAIVQVIFKGKKEIICSFLPFFTLSPSCLIIFSSPI